MNSTAVIARTVGRLPYWSPEYERATRILAQMAQIKRQQSLLVYESERDSSIANGGLPIGRLYGDTMTAADRLRRRK